MKTNDIEIRKDIKGYEGLYQVSNLGNVYSIRKKGLLKERITIGYAYVALGKNGIRRDYRNSRLVAQAFLGLNIEFTDAKKSMCVCHKDDNTRNNNVNNLFLGTNKENNKDMREKGRRKVLKGNDHPMYGKEGPLKGKFGKDHHLSKAIYQITLHGDIIGEYEGVRDAGRKTGINFGDISKVCKGKIKTAGGYIWKYVGSPTVSEYTWVNHVKMFY